MGVSSDHRESAEPLLASKSTMLPALKALLIQLASVVLSYVTLFLLGVAFSFTPSLLLFVALQAFCAAALAVLSRMDWWWSPIQLLFLPALILVRALNWPAYYFLLAFAVCALLFWSAFRTQVPYYPSRSSLYPVIRDLLPAAHAVSFVDIGSGLGGLLLKLASTRPDCSFLGVEIAPLPWLVSYLRSRFSAGSVQFRLQDYQNLDFAAYDFVFAYLSPAAMPQLWQKAKQEMKPGSTLLSYEFIIPDTKPDLCINTGGNAPILYAWRI